MEKDEQVREDGTKGIDAFLKGSLLEIPPKPNNQQAKEDAGKAPISLVPMWHLACNIAFLCEMEDQNEQTR